MNHRTIQNTIVLFALLLAVGCSRSVGDGSRINESNFDKIRTGMKMNDVVALLGEPTIKGDIHNSGDCVWLWKDGDRIIKVMFELTGEVRSIGPRVVKYGFNLDAPVPQKDTVGATAVVESPPAGRPDSTGATPSATDVDPVAAQL
ncbi:MAG: outer membrane protein assembly factor BamE domain-containing protein [Planctomycetota bacterium]